MAAAIDMRDTVPIPGPKGYPIVGNITDLDPELPIASLQNLAKQYGEIFSLTIFGKKRVFIASQRLMNEICDEKRFGKFVAVALAELRAGIHDGLFTAQNHEENWHLAHRVLVPAFGPLNITSMFDDMKDIASQLVLKWARYGSEYKIPTTDDFTRLTLDTLALCAMDYRFNSFYTDEMHPFITSMVNFLHEGGMRSRRPAYMAPFYRADEAQFHKDIEYMRNLSNDIVNKRKENPKETKDLLNAMLKGRDPKTGKALGQETIIDNMITFLIAGHETTSGLLSFLFHYLVKSPDAYRKAQEEVDRVIGKGSMEARHLNELPYITACLRETLRLQPTAPAFTVAPHAEGGELLGGKYGVNHGEPIIAVLPAVHRDPAVYGEDADEWKPERMLDEQFNALPPSSWKPFGNGARGCIGRPFAWQEAMMVTAMLLQYFNFAADDSTYNLQIKSTLTIKPKDFYMRATLRDGWTATKVEQSLAGSIRSEGPAASRKPDVKQVDENAQPLTVLYGSNSGTCEAFAQTVAADAAAHGFRVSKVDTLDSAKQALPAKEPVVIVTASYEGQPCDNASHFYNWLETMKDGEKVDSSYAVFGCGHSDWKQTFHRIPNSINKLLEEHGGKRICDMGSADAAKGDMMSAFQTWEDEVLWPALKSQYGVEGAEEGSAAASQSLSIQVSNRRASRLRADVSEAKVLSNTVLTAPGVPVKRQIELQLPSEMSYRAGDYLAVLPINPRETVHRVAQRFNLSWDAMLTISSKSNTALPTDEPISANDLFSAYVELSQPATKRAVSMLIEASKDDNTKKELWALMDGDFNALITEKRISVLDLLERYPNIDLPLGAFVSCLMTMRVRQYSISSSPLADPHKASLTYAVLESDAFSGQGRHVGVASNYLSHLAPGDMVHVAIKPSHAAFHLPTKPEDTPVIMLAAGTGIAPFMSFVQERAAQIGAGRNLAPAHLYFGCHHPEKDSLHAEQLDRWEAMGAVTVHRAFSWAPELSGGHKHVDTLIRADAPLLTGLWDQGARVFVCGSRELGESVKKVCLEIAKSRREERGADTSEEALNQWFDRIRNERQRAIGRAALACKQYSTARNLRSVPTLPDASIDTFRQQAFEPATPALLPRGTFNHVPAIAKWFLKASGKGSSVLEINRSYLSNYASTLVPVEITNQDNFARIEQPLSFFLECVYSHPSTSTYRSRPSR
ncbi:cytochrome P450, partial [Hortaea werneckii]